MSEITYRSIRENVTDLLRQEIFSGKLEEGSPVREIPLAKRFKVSRGPIRDAILQLTQQGLLRAEANRGARVGKVWGKEIRPLMVSMRLELESFALHKILESEDRNLDSLRKNLRQFEIACSDGDLGTVIKLDLEFHRLILRESGVEGLEAVWLPMMGGMRMPYSRHRRLLEVHEEHNMVFAAIEAGDRHLAIAALKRNLHLSA